MHFGLADASVWLVLIAVRLQLCTCSKYTCTIESDGFCIFERVHVEGPEQARDVQLEPPATVADVSRVKFRHSTVFMLPPGFYGAFRHLQELRVWWSNMHSIHVDSRLLELDAEKNRISSITTDPGTVPMLRRLELNLNRLRNIDNISVFENLEVLQLAHNDLRTLDLCVFQRMSRLHHLDLSSNNLGMVRSSIGSEKLTALTVLYLNDNKLTYLDLDVLKSFPALEKVYLSNNALVYVDHDALPTTLPRLRQFHLQINDWHCEALAELVVQLRKTGVQDLKAYNVFTCKDRMVEGVCCTDNKPFALVRKTNHYLANYASELNSHTRHLMRELQHTRHELSRLIGNDNLTQLSLQNLGDEVEELRNQLTDAIAAPDDGKATTVGRTVEPVDPERLVAELGKLRQDFRKMVVENQTLRQQLRQYNKLRQELDALRTDSNETKLSVQQMKEENALLREDLSQLKEKLFGRGASV